MSPSSLAVHLFRISAVSSLNHVITITWPFDLFVFLLQYQDYVVMMVIKEKVTIKKMMTKMKMKQENEMEIMNEMEV